MNRLAFFMIILGATLWGTIGVFVQALYDLGFSPIEVVTLRVTVAFLALFLYMLVRDRRALVIDWRHIPYFIGTGICSIVFFNWAYFTAIQEMNLSVAAVLLYTGPAFVTILSRFLFKEWFTPQKMIALITTFIGCILVIEMFPLNTTQLSTYGIIVGLGSGLGYALYSIFGKYALAKYSSLTTTTYTFLIATVSLIPTSGLVSGGFAWWSMKALWLSLGLGIIPTVFAYLFYTAGLRTVESSKASIAATIEPVVAALIGIFLFKDVVTTWQIVGMVCILSAVMFINVKVKEAGRGTLMKWKRGEKSA